MSDQNGPVTGRFVPVDSLRACITLLVVAHHAVLAYHPYAPKPNASLLAEPRLWGAFPIVDAVRWPGIDLLVGFNDAFFMSLMFLLSGLFVVPALRRQHAGGYLQQRAWRLGVPFLFAAGLLAPLAYAASYAQISATPSVTGFLREWFSLGNWPAGPAWFLWVLLSFDALVAMLWRAAPRMFDALADFVDRIGDRPARAFLALASAGALAYLPTAMFVDPMHWASAGPFFVQTARVPLYLVFFVAGIALGASGLARGLLATDGRLARRWMLWSNLAPLAFIALVAVFLVLLGALKQGASVAVLAPLCNLAFVVSAVTSSLMCLALALRFRRSDSALWLGLARNAYGIYLVHYPVTAWLQFALLDAPMSGAMKGICVVLGGIGLSALLSSALLRIPAVARTIGSGAPASDRRSAQGSARSVARTA